MHKARLGKLVVLIAALAGAARSEQPSRVSETNASSRVAIRGNVNPRTNALSDQGPATGSLPLPRVTLFFSRTADQQAQLDQLLVRQQDPSSPDYHRWLSPQEIADRFGMSEADMQKTVDWLSAQGFSVVERAASRSYVVFSGTTAEIQSHL